MNASVAKRFGENLRRCRKQVGISQEALGVSTSLHRSEIGLLERGQRMPRIDTIIKLSSGLDIEPDELLTGITWNAGTRQVITGRFSLRERERER